MPEVADEKSSRTAALTSANFSHLELLAGAVLIGALLYWLQYSTSGICCGDFDGYYHIKLTELFWEQMRQGSLRINFDWLPLTTLNQENYADQHFLYHVLLIPFTWFGDLQSGAKLATWLFASLALFSCYWLLVSFRVSYALLWLAALLASSAPFLYRLNMTRAQSLSLLFLVVGSYLLFKGKYRWLGVLALGYTWTYNLFVLLLVAVTVWTIVSWWVTRRVDWRALIWTTLGTAAGLVINPYFPRDVWLFLQHVVIKAIKFNLPAGTEWVAWDSWWLLKTSIIAFLAMVVGYFATGYAAARPAKLETAVGESGSTAQSNRSHLQKPLYLLFLSSFFLILTMRSSRFTEYWPPLAVLFAAFSLDATIGRRAFPPDNRGESSPDSSLQTRRWATVFGGIAPILVGMLLTLALWTNLRTASLMIQVYDSYSQDRDHYRRGGEWLRSNVAPGERIFNLTWMIFPKLFFYDTQHKYSSGLDPAYLHDQNPELWTQYERISMGQEPFPGGILRNKFGVNYVFVGDRRFHGDLNRFYDIATTNGEFEKLYEDAECSIFRIR